MADTIYLKQNLEGSVPTEIANEVIKNIKGQSTAFNVMRKVPMSSDKKVLPTLTDTGTAYFVEEGEKIGTAIHSWDYPSLEAKKLAVIIPVTKEKLADSVINVMEELKQGIADAFSRKIDSEILFGDGTVFPTSVYTEAVKQKVTSTGKANLDVDISSAMAFVEAEDLGVTNILTHNGIKSDMRNLRDTNGNYKVVPGGATGQIIFNTPISIVGNKAWDKSKSDLMLGDYSKAVIGVRDDITYEILKEATVGELNLAERDLVAVKCTMRFGFNIVDPKAFALIEPKATKTK